ncbi:bifunctional glycosyltransferase/CDP-glycerol:glycerophosphate glycerophosphotransferase [Galactobacter valiniphilus]|uniref:bifunctional glycosyltransferase/CDP-glycerol:glycerophosphate glycerophosphotransferase n=1 Tax=Galactobacter valiniphilus TaxID=2676122 RepID=UPI003734C4F3
MGVRDSLKWGLKATRSKAGQAKRAVLRKVGESSAAKAPELSVIVPAYKVEAYLEECLESILSQVGVRLEVIVVDDGSPDRSGEIADVYASRDSRVRVLHQANAGLGAARNAGTALAVGEFIAFVDSDDVVEEGAYQAMIASLKSSGSEFVVGSLQRRWGDDTWTPEWTRSVHAVDRIGIRLADHPEVLKSVFAWNKLYRRDFFDRVVQEFPEGIRYEDQLPAAKAYAGAETFDVLSRIVYTWLVREDGSSITQQKQNVKDLSDRVKVIHSVTEFFVQLADRELLQSWLQKALGFDLRPYVQEYPRVTDEYRELLKGALQEIYDAADKKTWDRMVPWDRLLVLGVLRGTVGDVQKLLASRERLGWGMDGRPHGEALRLVVDALDEVSFEVAPGELDVAPELVKLNPVLDGYLVRSDDSVELVGHAYIEHVDADKHPLTVRVGLRSATGDTVWASVEQGVDASLDDFNPSAFASRAASRFRALWAAEALADLHGEFTAVVETELAGVVRESPFLHRARPGFAWAFPVGSSTLRFKAEWLVPRGLTLSRVAPEFVARIQHISPDGLVVEMSLPEVSVAWTSKGQPDVLAVASSADGEWVLPFPVSTGAPVEWRAMGILPSGQRKVLHVAESSQQFESMGEFPDGRSARLTVNGALRLTTSSCAVLVAEAEIVGQVLRLGGTVSTEDGSTWKPYLHSVNTSREPLAPRTFRVQGGQWVAEFALIDAASGLPLAPGTFVLGSVAAEDLTYSLAMSLELKQSMPQHISTPSGRLRLSRVVSSGSLRVELMVPSPIGGRGRLALRRQLAELRQQQPQLEDATLFESFGGRSAGDSPSALARFAFEHNVGGKLYWAVQHLGIGVPAGTEAIVVGSPEYVALLHSARWVINNNNFPWYYSKPVGQHYTQTWHGTPLKRIANDVVSNSLSYSYTELMVSEANSWDVLLSQNEYSTRIFPGAFGYDGEVLTLGYPRNDDLAAPTGERVATIKSALGIPQGHEVVLYAPTWRDGAKTKSGAYALVSYLDLEAAVADGTNPRVILLRGHSNTRSGGQELPEGVIDVSNYPIVNDLIMIADRLVTDYSSIMFDFSVTAKPFHLLAPDLDEYGDETRGFYVDPHDVSPYPIAGTTAELLEQMTPEVPAPVAERYARFRAEFVPLDDGLAASRVGRVIWAESFDEQGPAPDSSEH